MRAAGEVVDRFLGAVAADPETRTLGVALVPYRAMVGEPQDLVDVLDRLTAMWTEAKRE